jgi:hypothetical protein
MTLSLCEMDLELIPKPVRPQKPTKWQLVRCSCSINCRGHILPSCPTNILQEESLQDELFVVGVYIPAWDSMRTRERKKQYKPKNHNRKFTKIFGKWS